MHEQTLALFSILVADIHSILKKLSRAEMHFLRTDGQTFDIGPLRPLEVYWCGKCVTCLQLAGVIHTKTAILCEIVTSEGQGFVLLLSSYAGKKCRLKSLKVWPKMTTSSGYLCHTIGNGYREHMTQYIIWKTFPNSGF